MKKLQRSVMIGYFNQATQLYQYGEIQESLDILKKIMALNPRNKQYWIMMTIAFMENQNFAEAFKCIKKITKFKNISKTQICILKGDVYFKIGKFKKAFNLYLKAGPQVNRNPDIKIRKVRCLIAHKRFKQALRTLEDISHNHDCSAVCQFLRGACFFYLGRYRFAINHFNFALMNQEFKQNTDLLEMKGNCFYNMKDYSKALIAYEQILALDPHQEHIKYLCYLSKIKINQK